MMRGLGFISYLGRWELRVDGDGDDAGDDDDVACAWSDVHL
jgi:hypothetical protein